jgi:hypothetical protein
MATSHDYDGSLSFVAPSGGATAGTIYKISATSGAVLALTTAASGAAFIGKIAGRANGVTTTTVAWVTGQRLSHNGTAFSTLTSVLAVVANAAAAKTAAAVTGDVILCPPQVA